MMDVLIDFLNIAVACWAIGYGIWQWRTYRDRDGALWCATGCFVVLVITFSALTRYVIDGTDDIHTMLWWTRQGLEIVGVGAWIALGLWLYLLKR